MLHCNILVVIQYANIICHVLRDLVPFMQFKKRENHPWKKDCKFTKKTLLHGCFSRFLNCTSGTKLRNDSHNGHSSEISVMSSLKYKFNILFISILKLLVIFVSSSQSYLLTK